MRFSGDGDLLKLGVVFRALQQKFPQEAFAVLHLSETFKKNSSANVEIRSVRTESMETVQLTLDNPFKSMSWVERVFVQKAVGISDLEIHFSAQCIGALCVKNGQVQKVNLFLTDVMRKV